MERNRRESTKGLSVLELEEKTYLLTVYNSALDWVETLLDNQILISDLDLDKILIEKYGDDETSESLREIIKDNYLMFVG